MATAYDPNGNPTTVTETTSSGVRTTAQAYDSFDRLIEVTDGHGKTLRYQYDPNGNRTVLSDPDGKVTRYSFDALNRVSTLTHAGGTSEYQYDRSSLLKETRHPNGSRAVQGYDSAGRLQHLDNLQGSSVVTSYDYQFDANGNRTRQVEVSGGAEETTTYAYDLADRLVEVAYPDQTTTYTYDAAYNRLTERSVDAGSQLLTDKAYAYDSRNRLIQVTDQKDPAQSVGYTFDANGNQTLKTKNGRTTTFVYDTRDKLVSAQEESTTLGLFRYDHAGRRIEKDLGGHLIRTSYDGDSALIQYDQNGTTLAKYDYGPRQLASLSHASEGRQYYLFDGLGSVSALTTAAGTLQVRYQYDAWGNERHTAGASFNRFGYTGHEKDTETGLYYFKARFYDPDTGRFLTQDSGRCEYRVIRLAGFRGMAERYSIGTALRCRPVAYCHLLHCFQSILMLRVLMLYLVDLWRKYASKPLF